MNELSSLEREAIRQMNRKAAKRSKRFRKGFGIKLDPADKEFSKAIRLRDRECVRCHSKVEFNHLGMPKTHQASHYFGRGQESTRFDLENVDTLCPSCHILWGSRDREDYRNFKINQLGQNRFNLLLIRSKTPCTKDRKLELIKAKQLIKKYLQQELRKL